MIVLTLVILGAVEIERWQTTYLKIDDKPQWQKGSWLIRGVNLVPMNADTIIPFTDVRINEGRITAIGPNLDAQGLKVIDAQGAYLSPGLIDMHVHVWDNYELGLYLASGVTAVRSLLGMPYHLRIRDEIARGELLGPVLFTSSPQLSGPDDGDILKKPVNSSDEARVLVAQYHEDGYDFIKTYNLLPEDMFDAVLSEAAGLKMPVVAHPSFRVDYAYHFSPLISSVEHTEDIYQQPLEYHFDLEKLTEVVHGYAESGQTHCPTLTVFFNLTEIYNLGEEVLETEQAAYINPFIHHAAGDYERHMSIRAEDTGATARINRQHAFHIESVRQLHQAGVRIICGTDAGIVNTAPGFSIHQELAFYREAGMTCYEALRTATVNPGEVYQQYHDMGTLQAGKKANLILSHANPLEDLSTLSEPVWVMVEGRLINQGEIKELKEKARDRKNFLATLIRVFNYILFQK